MDDEYDVINNDDRKDDENQDDVKLRDVFENAKAVLWATDWTVDTILTQIKRGNIDMNPKFQRRDAWDQNRKSKYIESLILGLPVPQIILAEKKGKNKKTYYIVIDGKQRLLTLIQFCLTTQYLSETGEFKEDDFDPIKPLKLKNIDIKELNGLTYSDLISKPELYGYRTDFDNQSIRTTIIRSWPNEDFLYRVFYRLNTGSLPLSPQELRQALHPGRFLDYIDEFTNKSTIFRSLFNIKKPDRRMRDIELSIRFIAFKYYLADYKSDLKKHLDYVCKDLNDKWIYGENKIVNQLKELENAIEFTYKIFGKNKAFKRIDNRGTINKAVYDIMVYYFSEYDIRKYITERKSKDAVVKEFNRLCEEDETFIGSIESSTKSTRSIVERISIWGKSLSKILNISLDIPMIAEGSAGSKIEIKIVKTKAA
ncbi:DUF262 domain-containing protein [Candidatus Magnetominusculus dajiuhuensis]|uniref:DUF262 domain-containing protein n=1 Tax=Candidatus Magnetominusculus dajiuhuensis TaxID=3137712 RepID=UPI003B433786